MKLLVGILVLALGGCTFGATHEIRLCNELAGRGWSGLSAPPANAAELLGLATEPPGSGSVGGYYWYGDRAGRILVCRYIIGQEGCSSDTIIFSNVDGKWIVVKPGDKPGYICV